MDKIDLVEKYKPVIDEFKRRRYDHLVRPWTYDKQLHVAIAIEEFDQAESGYHYAFDSFNLNSQESVEEKRERFLETILAVIKEYDEMATDGDDAFVENTVISNILKELEYAKSKWDIEFDNANTLNDWVTYICMYATDAAKMTSSPSEAKKKLYKAAGLAISALSTLERNETFAKRHYEDIVAKD